jgi:hypothetical protein
MTRRRKRPENAIQLRVAGAETAVVIGLDAALRQLEQWQLLRGRHES